MRKNYYGILSDSRHFQRLVSDVNPNYTRFEIKNVVDQANNAASTLADIYELDSIGNVSSTISFILASVNIVGNMGSNLNDNIAFAKECLAITSRFAERAESLSMDYALEKGSVY